MSKDDLKNSVLKATKWSSITELLAKLVSPISSIILARILMPEAFGVVATITMIISFADMFTDAGFQKYLVQHEFKNNKEKYKSANVAFWTNLFISVFFWIIIILLRNQIAILVGNPELGIVIAVACVQLIFTSFSSIQQALYRREFEFKVLFIVRLISIFVPFTVTLPLALLGFGYWSLIISSILIRFINAVILTMKSEWKPRFYYDIEVLKEMFSFSAWSLVEAITIWLTSWADAFVIGNTLSQYYLGLYKTSTNMVNNLLNLIKASVVPVLFSTLSRLQNDVIVFNNTFFRFQRIVSILVFPIGFGVYLYSDIATNILLGDQWKEASNVIGIWALTSSLMIVYGHFSSEIYRAKGRPKLSVLAQLLHLIVLIPTIIITAKYGFWILVLARSLVRFQLLIVHLLILKYFLDFPIKKLFTNVTEPLLASCIMVLSATYLKQISTGIIWSTVSIIICALIYFVILYLLPRTKVDINWIIKNLLPKNDSVINPNK